MPAGTAKLGPFTVGRMGYGAMQLAGPGAFGALRILALRRRRCARRLWSASIISIPAIIRTRLWSMR